MFFFIYLLSFLFNWSFHCFFIFSLLLLISFCFAFLKFVFCLFLFFSPVFLFLFHFFISLFLFMKTAAIREGVEELRLREEGMLRCFIDTGNVGDCRWVPPLEDEEWHAVG